MVYSENKQRTDMSTHTKKKVAVKKPSGSSTGVKPGQRDAQRKARMKAQAKAQKAQQAKPKPKPKKKPATTTKHKTVKKPPAPKQLGGRAAFSSSYIR